MPHQLCRVITINIRNPNGGLPSGRIAELDPRGGVLAVGDNGVGKTTFLRLLPLFYGATPTQILKGSGRSSMISYTLPDASSAVCFEYERDTVGDLRCVVMHARANEEAPQFHIVRSGYREEFFYDENNQYVDRDEFKARVEAMGIEVTKKLLLHQYRSVILNERLPTKEGAELRRLAAVHSLGPRALYNLDQISAAMANEKISFRDLQNIVLERVSDSQNPNGKTTNIKELKQSREAVVRWLEARGHLADIMARQPDALKVKEKIGKVKGLHLELCTLHVAVKEALVVANSELETLRSKETTEIERLNQAAQALAGQIDTTTKQLGHAKTAAEANEESCKGAKAKLDHFKLINAEELSAYQAQEGAFRERSAELETQIARIQDTTGDLNIRANDRRNAIQASFLALSTDLNSQRSQNISAYIDRLEVFRKAQGKAEGSIPRPNAAEANGDELFAIATRIGELNVQIGNASASPETIKELSDARGEVDRRQDVFNAAQGSISDAEIATREAKVLHDSALRKLAHQEEEEQKLVDAQSKAQAKLTPPLGSLLEFIRGDDLGIWSSVAKVLDPSLLHRTDLKPSFSDSVEDISVASSDESVRVGPAILDVTDVSTPAWVDMAAVRLEIEVIVAQASSLGEAISLTKIETKKAFDAHKKAEAAEQSAKAYRSLADSALQTAKHNRQRVANFAQEESLRRQTEAAAEVARLSARRDALIEEGKKAEAEYEQQIQAIRADFEQQRYDLGKEKDATESSITDARETHGIRLAEALAQVNADVQRELSGLGIDPIHLGKLQTEKSEVDDRLNSIAKNRHEVEAWKQFRDQVMPSMEAEQQASVRLWAEHHKLKLSVDTLRGNAAELERKGKLLLKDITDAIERRDNEAKHLQGLIDRDLKDFVDYVPAKLDIDWTAHNLADAVRKRKADLEQVTEELNKAHRSLRNELLKHPGGPADWLEHKEGELPDRQIYLPHQYLCEQANVLCDWYDPTECGPYIDQLGKEMLAFCHLAGEFVRVLDQFERSVTTFNTNLQKALGNTERFERFRDLSVTVSSKVSQLGYIKLLREMQDKGTRNPMAYRTVVRSEQDIPTDEDASLIRGFRDILQSDGAFKVNLNEQVRLECTLYENGTRRTITNEEEFRAVSSNGNTALITAMFLMGFVQMIRGDSPVRLTWVSDEIGRFDPKNLGAFLKTLDMHRIDVISACPSIDPALARFFPRLCIFENNGAVLTSTTHSEELGYEAA